MQHILLTNDDGYKAKILQPLILSLKKIAKVTVVAPQKNCSGISHSITIKKGIYIQKISDDFYIVKGSPVDAIKLALSEILNEKPDLVISGINAGPNLGNSILYSGTVAAAKEASLFNIPSIAFSAFDNRPKWDIDAIKICEHFLIDGPLTKLWNQSFLNINIPDLPIQMIKGYRLCELGKRNTTEYDIHKNEKGQQSYHLKKPRIPPEDQPNSDFNAIKEGYISVTPIYGEWVNFSFQKSLFEAISNMKF